MNKFIVGVNDNIEGLINVLTDQSYYGTGDVKVSEYHEPEPETVPMVRTGVLKNDRLPGGYFIWCNGETFKNGDTINLDKHPRLESYCKDVNEEIDWTKVKEGDIIEAERDNQKRYGNFKYCKNGFFSFGNCVWNAKTIKSIRIIERAKNV